MRMTQRQWAVLASRALDHTNDLRMPFPERAACFDLIRIATTAAKSPSSLGVVAAAIPTQVEILALELLGVGVPQFHKKAGSIS